MSHTETLNTIRILLICHADEIVPRYNAALLKCTHGISFQDYFITQIFRKI